MSENHLNCIYVLKLIKSKNYKTNNLQFKMQTIKGNETFHQERVGADLRARNTAVTEDTVQMF